MNNTEVNTKEKNNKPLIITVVTTLVIVILILLLLLVKGCNNNTDTNIGFTNVIENNLSIADNANDEYEKPESILEGRNVYFAGIADTTVGTNTNVYLENLPENDDIYMKYKIINADTKDVIYETDLIPSGKHVTWKCAEDLQEGENHLVIEESPYYPTGTGYMLLTTGKNEVTFTFINN